MHDWYADLAAGLEEEKAPLGGIAGIVVQQRDIGRTLVVVHFLRGWRVHQDHTQDWSRCQINGRGFKEAVGVAGRIRDEGSSRGGAVLLLYWLIMRSLEYGADAGWPMQ